MIRTPQARKRRVARTRNGVRLRGAMLWVALGVAAGLAGAVFAFALSLAVAEGLGALIDRFFEVCPNPAWWLRLLVAIVTIEFYLMAAKGLWMLRGPVAGWAKPRYEAFAADIADWFGLGALLALGVGGLPLYLLLIFGMNC